MAEGGEKCLNGFRVDFDVELQSPRARSDADRLIGVDRVAGQDDGVGYVERVAVPLQDVEVRGEPGEELIGLPAWGDRHGPPPDFRSGLARANRSIRRQREELGTQTDTERRSPTVHRLPQQADFGQAGGKPFVGGGGHRAPHDDEAFVLSEVGWQRVAGEDATSVHRHPGVLQRLIDGVAALGRDVLDEKAARHRRHTRSRANDAGTWSSTWCVNVPETLLIGALTMFERLLLAIDDSPASEVAAAFAAALALHGEGQVRVFHVNEHQVAGGGLTLLSAQEADALMRRMVSELCEQGVRASGVSVAAPYRQVSMRIVGASDEWNADAIVVGSNRSRRFGVSRLFSARIRERTTRLTALPVLTAPPPLRHLTIGTSTLESVQAELDRLLATN